MPRYHTGEAWTPNNTTSVGTGAATLETDLQTIVIPAAALTTGDIVRLRASGTTSGTAVSHAVALYFGATIVVQFGGFASADDWSLEAVVAVTGAATQKASAIGVRGASSATVVHDYTTPAETIANAITVKTTGTTPNSGDEVTSELLVVEIIPA